MKASTVPTITSRKYLWQIVAISWALVFTYATVLTKLTRDWWTDENYSHGLLIPFIILFVLWSQREQLTSATRRPSMWYGLSAVLVALLALWAGTAGAELYLQRTSLVLILRGPVFFLCGLKDLRVRVSPV